jgi:bacillithiol synthase
MPLESTQPHAAPAAAPSSWLEAYFDGRLRDFHRVPAGDLDAALQGTHPADRALLEAAASAYLKRIGAPKKALQNAARLAHPNSRVVITGQQAGLLTGPAYTISKAINTILLARRMDTDDQPVVPVFWVASQDHDVAEVASTRLLDLNEQEHVITLELPANRPVGRIALRHEWVERCLEELRDFAAPEEFKKPVYDLIESAARASSTYAEWFARIVSGLLGSHGLVVVDPLTPEFAPLFAPFIRQELQHPLEGTQAIEDAAIALEKLGFAPQLRRPAGSTNLFLEGDDHQRRLLRFEGHAFQADRAYSQQELEAILEADPSRLTPAAGLRPTLADAILPSAVSILGPSELAYQLELAGVYALHNVPQPLLWPRMSVTWLEPPTRRILTRYDLNVDAFVSDPTDSLERTLLERSGAAESFRAGLVDLELAFERLASHLDPLDPTLAGALERSRSRVMGHVARLEKKVASSLVRLEDTADHQFQRLNLHLKPHGTPQERSENFLSFLMKYGPYTFETMLKLEPHGSHILEI